MKDICVQSRCSSYGNWQTRLELSQAHNFGSLRSKNANPISLLPHTNSHIPRIKKILHQNIDRLK